MATKAKKSARKKTRMTTRRAGAKKTMRASAKKRPAAKTTRRKSAVARVKAVATEVVHQAQVAVASGVETLRDLGGNLVDRVKA
jgi:hypothetical protein